MACIATLAVHRWRLTIFISVIFFVCAFGMWRSGTLDASNIFTVLGFAAIRIASLVVFARAVLGLHPYGNGMRASLFLLSVWTIRYPIVLDLNQHISQATLLVALTVLAVLVARAGTRRLKEIALKLGVLCYSVVWILVMDPWRGEPLVYAIAGFILGTIVFYSIFSLIILWPLGSAVDRSPDASSLTME